MRLIPLRSFAADERGATAIEYALIASIISIVIASALGTIATYLNGVLNAVSAAF